MRRSWPKRANGLRLNNRDRIDMDAVEVDMPSAVSAALESAQGAVIEVELERERGDLIWEIEFADAQGRIVEVELDTITGGLLEQEVDDDPAPDVSTFVSLNDALTAVASTETGSFIEAELELDDGVQIWEIKTLDANHQRHEHRVDAASGTVL